MPLDGHGAHLHAGSQQAHIRAWRRMESASVFTAETGACRAHHATPASDIDAHAGDLMLDDLPVCERPGAGVVNGMGGTPLIRLYILCAGLPRILPASPLRATISNRYVVGNGGLLRLPQKLGSERLTPCGMRRCRTPALARWD